MCLQGAGLYVVEDVFEKVFVFKGHTFYSFKFEAKTRLIFFSKSKAYHQLALFLSVNAKKSKFYAVFLYDFEKKRKSVGAKYSLF